MKKLLLSTAIAAVMVLSASASQAATETGTAEAIVATPIVVTSGPNMNFGTFAIDADATNATVHTNGDVASEAQQLTTPSNGYFDITGEDGATYHVAVADTYDDFSTNEVTLRLNGTATIATKIMTATLTPSLVNGTEYTFDGSTVEMTVTGVIAGLTATKAAGSYSGTYNVSVTYP